MSVDLADLPDRLVRKISIDDKTGCWLWTASLRGGGYAHFSPTHRTNAYAHRFIYELVVGAIPAGLQLDHLCRVRHCVNPAHLEPVTAHENIHRGEGLAALNAHKAECKRGHPLSGDNLYIYASDGRRSCRECMRMHQRRYRAASLI